MHKCIMYSIYIADPVYVTSPVEEEPMKYMAINRPMAHVHIIATAIMNFLLSKAKAKIHKTIH